MKWDVSVTCRHTIGWQVRHCNWTRHIWIKAEAFLPFKVWYNKGELKVVWNELQHKLVKNNLNEHLPGRKQQVMFSIHVDIPDFTVYPMRSDLHVPYLFMITNTSSGFFPYIIHSSCRTVGLFLYFIIAAVHQDAH